MPSGKVSVANERAYTHMYKYVCNSSYIHICMYLCIIKYYIAYMFVFFRCVAGISQTNSRLYILWRYANFHIDVCVCGYLYYVYTMCSQWSTLYVFKFVFSTFVLERMTSIILRIWSNFVYIHIYILYTHKNLPLYIFTLYICL